MRDNVITSKFKLLFATAITSMLLLSPALAETLRIAYPGDPRPPTPR